MMLKNYWINVCSTPSFRDFARFWDLKTGIHFAHFGLESGIVFKGITGVYEHIYRFNSK